MHVPADEGVFVQPGGQFFLPGYCEGHPVAASDAPQFDSQFFLQQTSESEAEGRSFRVPAHVVPDPVEECLAAGGAAICG